jgi:hypothetical protein
VKVVFVYLVMRATFAEWGRILAYYSTKRYSVDNNTKELRKKSGQIDFPDAKNDAKILIRIDDEDYPAREVLQALGVRRDSIPPAGHT